MSLMSEEQRLQDLLDREIFFGGAVGVLPASSVLQPLPKRVGFKRLTDTAILPVRAHATDSGFDLFADEDVTIRAGEYGTLISTGIAVKLPPGYEAQVRPRSGVSSKTSLRVVLGTVDNGYSGEISVIMDNIALLTWYTQLEWDEDGNVVDVDADFDEYTNSIGITKGSKIAQLVVVPYYVGSSYEVKEELPETDRGTSGFGSTGTSVTGVWHGLTTEL